MCHYKCEIPESCQGGCWDIHLPPSPPSGWKWEEDKKTDRWHLIPEKRKPYPMGFVFWPNGYWESKAWHKGNPIKLGIRSSRDEAVNSILDRYAEYFKSI